MGRSLVEALLMRPQYSLTLFNRNRTGVSLFPEVPRIQGNRQSPDDIARIAATPWQYVIDFSAYYPETLAQTLALLNPDVTQYIFISTCSVYDLDAPAQVPRLEDAPMLSCSAAEATDSTAATYGARKAECERVLQASGFRYVVLRPALVYGLYDPTDRLYYWLHQVRQFNPLLLPANGSSKLSLTYAGDMVSLILQLLNTPLQGRCYNAVSHPAISIGELVQEAARLLHRQPGSLSAPPAFLHTHQVSQWTDMPLWIDGNHFTFGNQKLREELDWVPQALSPSLAHTLAYYESLNWPVPKYGMDEQRRQELIRKLTL